MSDLRTIIIGAGLGGLCLAQSLARAGLDVQLFERDEGPFDRPQGYRLHLDADAIEAAREVLPADLHALFTSVPCELDAPTNVTLLGDAIHAMTPTLGRGANIAMRDGALLGRALRATAAGDLPLAEALVAYERRMLDYGFAVVREAAAIGQQRMAQNPLPA